MRILALQVDNILRAVAVNITPNGRVVELTGKNRQGKTSVLEAIWMALGGEKAIPEMPVHDGAEAGTIIVDIGDDSGLKYKVTRRIRLQPKVGKHAFSTSLTVESADGARFQRPQDILNTLVGAFSADPLRLVDMNDKDLFNEFKKFVPGVDFAAIEQANAKDFAQRTEVNRRVKSLLAQAHAIAVPKDAPTELIDDSALVDEMQRAGEHNTGIILEKRRRDDHQTAMVQTALAIGRCNEDIDSLRKRIEALERERETYSTTYERLKADARAFPQLPEPIDATALRDEISNARDSNAVFAQAQRRKALEADAEAAAAESDALTNAIATREEDKIKQVAAAKMPVDGITFGDGVVLLNGFPLSQASGAERIRTAVAVQAALNPKLRFVRIKSADALDDESWAMLEKMAEEMDFQVFCETVQSDRPTAVVIEDGRVKGESHVS